MPQLLDFLYRYVSETLSDADAFAEAAAGQTGGVLAPDHISLALAAREARNAGGGAPPPSLAALTAMASARNARPLPALARAQGLHPPPDADALLTTALASSFLGNVETSKTSKRIRNLTRN